MLLIAEMYLRLKTASGWPPQWEKNSIYLLRAEMPVFKEGLRDSQARYGLRNDTVGTKNTFIKEPSVTILLTVQNCPDICQTLLKKLSMYV